jgi:hypothetical protein
VNGDLKESSLSIDYSTMFSVLADAAQERLTFGNGAQSSFVQSLFSVCVPRIVRATEIEPPFRL